LRDELDIVLVKVLQDARSDLLVHGEQKRGHLLGAGQFRLLGRVVTVWSSLGLGLGHRSLKVPIVGDVAALCARAAPAQSPAPGDANATRTPFCVPESQVTGFRDLP